MPGERRYGMDHEHYEWSPIPDRRTLSWPDNNRVAFCVIINLEHLEWMSEEPYFHVATLHDRPFPDYRNYSQRQYGHRVGIFRLLGVLEKYGIKPTVAIDVLTLENYPYLVKYCIDKGFELIGHGISINRMITSQMSAREEKTYIHDSLSRFVEATGVFPKGWIGPGYGESYRTPSLLAEAGITYVCDWVNDEQPYRMKTSKGEVFALPLMLDMDDEFALIERRYPVDDYAKLIKEGFDTIYSDAKDSGRVLAINLHPWIIGQPYRTVYLDHVLDYISGRKGVWLASGGEIIDWYRRSMSG